MGRRRFLYLCGLCGVALLLCWFAARQMAPAVIHRRIETMDASHQRTIWEKEAMGPSLTRSKTILPSHLHTPTPKIPHSPPHSAIIISSQHNITSDFCHVLMEHADEQRTILLAVVDLNTYALALNFHRLSIQRLRLANYLFVCVDEAVVALLRDHGIYCFPFTTLPILQPASNVPTSSRSLSPTSVGEREQDVGGHFGSNEDVGHFVSEQYKYTKNLSTAMVGLENGDGAHFGSDHYQYKNVPTAVGGKDEGKEDVGDFGSDQYKYKTNLKALVALNALQLGFTVLVCDLDVILFRNPFPYFTCQDCDVHIQMDRTLYNSGFVFVRPTVAGVQLYRTAWQLYQRYKLTHDQAYLNMAMKTLADGGNNTMACKIHTLSTRLFPCGKYYFEDDRRMFAIDGPACKECVMVHNNYIGSLAAKIYRFKENLLWEVDEAGYYSDPAARYIVYNNSMDWGESAVAEMELDALRCALAIGNLTGRIVVLPAFRCCDCQAHTCASVLAPQKCSLLTVTKLKSLDAHFPGRYREHMFLKHSLVPDVFKVQPESTYAIKSALVPNFTRSEYGDNSNSQFLDIFHPLDIGHGATSDEIIHWFGARSDVPVLHFHSLYKSFSHFTDSRRQADFQARLADSFKCTHYEQWDVEE